MNKLVNAEFEKYEGSGEDRRAVIRLLLETPDIELGTYLTSQISSAKMIPGGEGITITVSDTNGVDSLVKRIRSSIDLFYKVSGTAIANAIKLAIENEYSAPKNTANWWTRN